MSQASSGERNKDYQHLGNNHSMSKDATAIHTHLAYPRGEEGVGRH